jgi:tetratricopeptide (TPR) repeat protein
MNLFKQTCLVLLICISISLTFQTSAFAVPKAVKAKSEYMLAEQFYNEGKFQDCIKHALIAKDTLGKSNSRIEYILTSAYYKNNQFDKAMTSVNLFFELTPESASGTKQYNEIVELYSKIELANKKSASEYHKQAESFERKKNYEQALSYYSKAIKADPENTEFYINKYWIYYAHLKEYEKSLQVFYELLKAMPKSSIPYRKIAGFYTFCTDKGYRDSLKAVEFAQKAVNIKKSGKNFQMLAQAYNANQQYDKVTETFQKAIELQPDLSGRYQTLAKFYATCPDKSYRDGSKAVELALKSVSLNKGSFMINFFLNTLGAAYVENKEFEKAIQTYEKTISSNSSYSYYRETYKKFLKEKGFYSGPIDGAASPELKEAIRKCVMQGQHIPIQ